MQYVEFSVDWYKDAGSTITITVAFLILSPHLANGSLLMLRFLRQFYDQHFTFDSSNTRQYTQDEYEAIHTGNEFQIEYRFTNMIVFQYVIFFYSSAMPILYFFGFLAFLVSYLFDKWYLFYFYKKPSTFDETLV